jgi:ketol-acid reductoisomerase
MSGTDEMRVFTKDDVPPGVFDGRTVAVIGYGSQGRAHARNLRDSGIDVIVGARPGGASEDRAAEDGFRVISPENAASEADLVAILAPDMAHSEIYERAVAPNLRPGATLLFAHGFSVFYGRVRPRADIDVIMVAPKGPGDLVRREYERGRGVPCLFAIHQDTTGEATSRALAYADGVGGTAAAVFETTFKEETETDLFGEQAVLCGGVTELVVAGYETLVEAGYRPEMAYYECLHELKLIVDLLHEGGLAKMHEFISETAIYGDLRSGPRVIDPSVKDRMRQVLRDVQDGTFARDWIMENQAGKPQYDRLLAEDLAHPIEAVGARLRGHMSWLRPGANNAAE